MLRQVVKTARSLPRAFSTARLSSSRAEEGWLEVSETLAGPTYQVLLVSKLDVMQSLT
jgi:hypothetical protein